MTRATVSPELGFPPFQPSPWLPTPEAMTLVGAFSRPGLRSLSRKAERRLVRVDDGTRIRVEVDRPSTGGENGMVVLHGLAGSSEAVYVVGTAWKAMRAGFVVARMNARNCGGTEELTEEHYNGAETADIEAAAMDLRANVGVRSVHLVGFSVGANQVLRLMQRWGDDVPDWISGVTVVSPCLDFATSSDLLAQSLFGRLVQRRFLRRLQGIVNRRYALSPTSFELGAARPGTIREFDHRFTGPLGGFEDADDYYRRASMAGQIGRAHVPTLWIASRDDPLVPFWCLRGLREADDPLLTPLITECGGHVAWVGRGCASSPAWQDLDRYWAENRVVQFAATCARLETTVLTPEAAHRDSSSSLPSR